MLDTLVILNLQNFKRDSYISVICQASEFAVEGRKADADTHLAIARSQNTGTGILGELQVIKAAFMGCLFRYSAFHLPPFMNTCFTRSSSLHILWISSICGFGRIRMERNISKAAGHRMSGW